VGKIDFVEPLKNNPEQAKQQAINWAKNIVNQFN
jgi:hypothetical protein